MRVYVVSLHDSLVRKVEGGSRKGERYAPCDCSHGDSRFWDALGREKSFIFVDCNEIPLG